MALPGMMPPRRAGFPMGGSLIPTMTAATTSGVTFSASSTFGTPGNEAWRAGDKVTATGGIGTGMWLSAIFTVASLTIQLRERVRLSAYAVTNDGAYHGLSGWNFQGSNDGSSWTTIETQSSQSFSGTETKTYALTTTAEYKYYRFDGTAYYGQYSGLVEVQLYN